MKKHNFEDMVMKERPDVRWVDVIGVDDAKNALRESIVYPTKRPDLFPLGWPRGILLYGPPGCGKTVLAAATANELDGYFINVDGSSMMSKWLGEAEKNVSKLSEIKNQLTHAKSFLEQQKLDEVASIIEASKIYLDEIINSFNNSENKSKISEIATKNENIKKFQEEYAKSFSKNQSIKNVFFTKY